MQRLFTADFGAKGGLARALNKQLGIAILVVLAALLAILLAVPVLASAPTQETAPVPDAQPFVVRIPANSTVKMTVYGHCMIRGVPFPGATLEPVGLAPDEVRVALSHSVAQGYIPSNRWDVQLAVWTLLDGIEPGAGNKLAPSIIEYAISGVEPSDAGMNTPSLIEAINDGSVTAQVVGYHNLSNPAYFGVGTLVIENMTDDVVDVHIPYGMHFEDQVHEGVQDMAIFPAGSPAEAVELGAEGLPIVVGTEGPVGPQGEQGPQEKRRAAAATLDAISAAVHTAPRDPQSRRP
jgi:hypothetical protein